MDNKFSKYEQIKNIGPESGMELHLDHILTLTTTGLYSVLYTDHVIAGESITLLLFLFFINNNQFTSMHS